MERAVFDHGGTLDKFLGDGVMATFGTPETSPADAANALACARAMLAEIDAWNARRAAAGLPTVKLSVGVHYGDVVLGDIGTARRLEFAVLGDTVNVAARLETLTRKLHCRIAASDELVSQARDSRPGEALFEGFAVTAEQQLRGRGEPVKVWTYGEQAA